MSVEQEIETGRSAPISEEETFGLAPWILDELDDDDALALLEALEAIEGEDKAERVSRFVPKKDQVQRRATLAEEYLDDAATFIARTKVETVRPLTANHKGLIRGPDQQLEAMLKTSLTRASMSFQNQARRTR